MYHSIQQSQIFNDNVCKYISMVYKLCFSLQRKYSLHGTHTETLFLVICKLMGYVRECFLKHGDQFSSIHSKDVQNGCMETKLIYIWCCNLKCVISKFTIQTFFPLCTRKLFVSNSCTKVWLLIQGFQPTLDTNIYLQKGRIIFEQTDE